MFVDGDRPPILPRSHAVPEKKKSSKSSIQSIFKLSQDSKPKIITDIKGKKWNAELVVNPQAKKESGATQQGTVILTDAGGITQKARVKKIENLNEAITYHMINCNEANPLHTFMPRFITILDNAGNPIDIQDELEKCGNSIEKLCKKKEFQPTYIIIRDLVNEIDEQNAKVVTEEIKDFKMVRPSLQGTNLEKRLHGHSTDSFVYRSVRKVFFSLSGCSFAFQEGTKSKWYTIVITNIKRLMSLRKTKTAIQAEFEKLSPEQLQCVQSHLINLRKAMKNSGYAFSDASLLFLPSIRNENGKQVNVLDIRLIDMSYALSREEITDRILEEQKYLENLKRKGLDNTSDYKKHEKKIGKLENDLKEYSMMEIDMENSIKEMETMLAEILTEKVKAGSS